jgi:tight adherence protein C
VIRWLLLAACLVAAAEARAAWRRDRRLNGRDVRRVTDRLDALVAAGRACRRLGLRCPAPPIRRDRLIERSGLGARLGEQDVDDARLGSVMTFASVGAAGLLLLRSPAGIVVAVSCAGFGWLFPDLWLRSAATRRANEIERQAPLTIDLIASAVAAGISIDEAIRGAASSAAGPLQAELEAVSANLALGHRRAAELRDLGERTASPSLMRLATALRISDRLGVPLAAGLRRQAARARMEQSRAVQERAAKAAPRILLVVVFLLVPAAMLPVMTALALAASSSIGSFLAG